MSDEDRRASCHIQAQTMIAQARRDCDGTEHDVFDVLAWRLGEMMHDNGLSWDCWHPEALTAMRAELNNQ